MVELQNRNIAETHSAPQEGDHGGGDRAGEGWGARLCRAGRHPLEDPDRRLHQGQLDGRRGQPPAQAPRAGLHQRQQRLPVIEGIREGYPRVYGLGLGISDNP